MSRVTPSVKKVGKIAPTKAGVLRAAELLGATVEDAGDEIRIDAPDRHHWFSGYQQIVLPWRDWREYDDVTPYIRGHKAGTKAAGWAAAAEDMEGGIEPCDFSEDDPHTCQTCSIEWEDR